MIPKWLQFAITEWALKPRSKRANQSISQIVTITSIKNGVVDSQSIKNLVDDTKKWLINYPNDDNKPRKKKKCKIEYDDNDDHSEIKKLAKQVEMLRNDLNIVADQVNNLLSEKIVEINRRIKEEEEEEDEENSSGDDMPHLERIPTILIKEEAKESLQIVDESKQQQPPISETIPKDNKEQPISPEIISMETLISTEKHDSPTFLDSTKLEEWRNDILKNLPLVEAKMKYDKMILQEKNKNVTKKRKLVRLDKKPKSQADCEKKDWILYPGPFLRNGKRKIHARNNCAGCSVASEGSEPAEIKFTPTLENMKLACGFCFSKPAFP
jgi:hypothetical protein